MGRNEFLSKPNTKTKSKIGCYKEHNFRSRESYKRMRTLPSATASVAGTVSYCPFRGDCKV